MPNLAESALIEPSVGAAIKCERACAKFSLDAGAQYRDGVRGSKSAIASVRANFSVQVS